MGNRLPAIHIAVPSPVQDCQFRERSRSRSRERRETNQRQDQILSAIQQQNDQRFQMQQQQHEAEMAEYRRTHERMIADHGAQIEKLAKELEEAKEEPFDPKDPDRLMRKQGENFDKFCSLAKDYLKDVPKLKKSSIAVLGPSGVGKSTIINAFAGRKVAETDVIECTQEISMVHASPEYDMYDVPGCHDERADFYNVDNLHKLKSLHLILIVYTDRFQHASNVAKLLKTIDLPYIMVRNKCNFAREGAGAMDRAYADEKQKAGEAPLMYLGYAPVVDAIPEGTDKLKNAVKALLAKSH